MTPDLLDGLIIIAMISLSSCILAPLLCWLFISHAQTIEHP